MSVEKQGVVKVLLRKEASMKPMIPAEELQVKARYGIEGNANSDPIAPGQVLLTSVQTLAEFELQPGDLRENIVVSGLDVDAILSGSVIRIGDTVQIRVTIPCAPCGYIKEVLGRTPADLIGKRGTLGVALTSGAIRTGDAVHVVPDQYPPVPTNVYERFLWILHHVPAGRIITYKRIAHLLGEGGSFARAVPGYIKRAQEEGTEAPFHRVVNTEGEFNGRVDDQTALLAAEGVHVEGDKVDTDPFAWESDELFYQK